MRLGEYNTTNPGRDCVSVSAGGTDCTDPLVKIGIEKTIPHPDYQPYHFLRKHDIGLIRLQSIAPFTGNVVLVVFQLQFGIAGNIIM